MSTDALVRPNPRWSADALARLADAVRCPVCERGVVDGQRCRTCGADFREIGAELWDASQAAADALRARQSVLDRVPVVWTTAPAGTRSTGELPATAAATAVAASAHRPPARAANAPAASATVQSVLAVAGAGLVAIAAVVFTFFNPDLTDTLARTLIVGGIAAVFAAGAAVLARRRLTFSAESVGALGVVFAALTVTSALGLMPAGWNSWVVAALATLAAGGALVTFGLRVGIRAWVWSGTLALSFVPVTLAHGAGSTVATIAGCLTSAAAASALVSAVGGVSLAGGGRLTAERLSLTVAQFVFVGAALANAAALTTSGREVATADPAFVAIATLLTISVLATFSADHPAGGLWSFVAGGAAVLAATVLPLTAPPALAYDGWFAAFPTAAGIGLLAVGALRPLHRVVRRSMLLGGAVTVVAFVAVIPTATALLSLAALVAGRANGLALLTDESAAALTTGLAVLAISLGGFAALTAEPPSAGRRPHEQYAAGGRELTASVALPPAGPLPGTGDAPEPIATQPLGTRWLGHLGAWYGVLAFLTVLCLPGLELWARIALALSAALVAAAVVAARLPAASAATRMPLVVGAHAAVALATVLSWRDDDLTIWAGAAIVASLAALAVTMPRAARFVHVGIGFAYALIVLATALARTVLDPVAVLCLTTCAAGLAAIVATFARRVPAREWHAMLVVTAVPFAIGVVQVLFERSGWTALSTGVTFLLALTLSTTRRTGLGTVVRTVAAGILVPALSVVVVCLGAQLLATSGSPVVLPVIAMIVATVLGAGGPIRAALKRRVAAREARAASLAIEASALLTAVIAVALSLWRDAAGLSTAVIVLVVLAVGFGASALFARRRYGWWLAGAAMTGALWCVWGITEVTDLEPYVLPPALGAALIGAVLTARGRAATGLYGVGLALAVVPVLVLLAIAGSEQVGIADPAGIEGSRVGSGSGFPTAAVRAYALVAAAWLLVAGATVIGRASSTTMRRLRPLRASTLGIAIIAAAASAVQGVRWGVGADPAPAGEAPLIVACVAFGLVGAASAAVAARGLHTQASAGTWRARTRWLGAPAVLYVTVASWPAIARDWFTIWTMWGLLVALLGFMVFIAGRGLRHPTALPPVWFLFAVSFITAVVAWSPRDLRVEWFSLPLGFFLLLAGALAMRASSRTETASAETAPVQAPPTLADWPARWRGSWPLLGPGLIVMLSASVAATYTDPRTWRAILVMVIALAAILIGANRRLAAPFVLGIVVLPVENVLAFAVQIGRGIEAMPWWITLSVIGAVLLIIAVGYERRTGDDTGLAARLRDLA
ncbi:hypothetical protein K0817_002000 [Microbacterium sp. HD4P20]|uniref:SCO7613 C-terminal domain-containing membrane protein n=1 Tax=Microbacterium sp. HD4P20 TaxID=2864874 RepID=UPI001C63CFC7|nr:hypothetical protein [Microbacterium sp. HD4P20]MCP2635338.1 hypothetical protein [Microbacterium sp. HD4P20]